MRRYLTPREKLSNRIDDLAQMNRIWEIGFSMGTIHGHQWIDALKTGKPFPVPPRSTYKRLQKHCEKMLKRMK